MRLASWGKGVYLYVSWFDFYLWKIILFVYWFIFFLSFGYSCRLLTYSSSFNKICHRILDEVFTFLKVFFVLRVLVFAVCIVLYVCIDMVWTLWSYLICHLHLFFISCLYFIENILQRSVNGLFCPFFFCFVWDTTLFVWCIRYQRTYKQILRGLRRLFSSTKNA